ncbi:unnamed protein product, partial [Ectocarpus sp. 12 AP-2014]
ASNLVEPSVRLPLSRRGEPPSSRSRCHNLCAAPCGPKPVWNVTLPESFRPPRCNQLPHAHGRNSAAFAAAPLWAYAAHPWHQSACGFRAWHAAGRAGGANFPGSGGIWPLPAPGAHPTPPANTPTPPGLLPPPCGGAKSTRSSGVGLVLLGWCAVRVLGLSSNQE